MEQEQYIWQVFHQDQILSRTDSIIAVAPFGLICRTIPPEQWTVSQQYEDGSVLAYKPVMRPEQGA